MPPRAVNLEDEAGLRSLADACQHFFPIRIPEVFTADFFPRKAARFFRSAAEVVNAGHVEVYVPAFGLDEIDDLWNVRADSREDFAIAHDPAVIANHVHLSKLPLGVGMAAVVIDRDRLRRCNGTDMRRDVRHLRGGLRDPLQVAALEPVFVQEPQNVPVAARLPGGDSGSLAVTEESLHVPGGEVVRHLPARLGIDMRVAADGIAADDQARHRMRAKPNGVGLL